MGISGRVGYENFTLESVIFPLRVEVGTRPSSTGISGRLLMSSKSLVEEPRPTTN